MKPLPRTALAVAGAVGVVAAAVGVGWLVRSSRNESLTAALYGAYIALGGIALTLLMSLGTWWLNGRRTAAGRASAAAQLAAAADWLAAATAARWQQEAVQRRIVTPAPATVEWRWAEDYSTISRSDAVLPPPPGTGPPPLPDLGNPGELLDSGVVARLHDEVYARLPHGRLVLVGGPGSGKTGAMILLLLAALAGRDSLSADERARVPVPVWLTLGGWNPESQTLHEAVVATLDRDSPALRAPDYGSEAPAELLRAGRVALFLDGLDEMPPGIRSLALKRIDAEARALRAVLTTRPGEFRSAVEAGSPDNTAVIELRPVRPRWAAAYLLHGQTGHRKEMWQRVAGHLASEPGSMLAHALDNPLNLSLARDTYAAGDPTELLDPDRFGTAEAVRVHLIDQFLVAVYPDEADRAYAARWLGWLAAQMGTSRDLRWWDIAGWVPRWRLRLARGVMAGAAVGVAILIAGWASLGLHESLPLACWAGVTTGLVVGLLARLRVRYPKSSGVPSRPRLNPLSMFVIVLAVVGVIGAAREYPYVLGTLAAGGLIGWAWLRRRAPVKPSVVRAGGLRLVVPVLDRPAVRGLVAGGIFGAIGGVITAVLSGNASYGLDEGIGDLLAISLVFGLASWARSGRSRSAWSWSAGSATPRAIVPRWPRGRELALTVVLAVVFFPLLVPVLLARWATPAANFPSATTAVTYRTDRRACVVSAFVYAIPAALLAALVAGTLPAQTTNQLAVLPAVCWGLASGIAVWVVAWLAAGQVPLLMLTELALGRRQGRRVYFMGMLADALGRQVLRQAGSVYQFRHEALQSRLALRYASDGRAEPAGSAAPPSPPAPEQMGTGEQGMQNVGGGGAG